MSKAEILAELPKLSAQDRSDILSRLWQMEEASAPSPQELELLCEEQAAYEKTLTPVPRGPKSKPACVVVHEMAAADSAPCRVRFNARAGLV